MTRKLKKDDNVIVIAGNHKGLTGNILRFSDKDRVVVQGINVRKKHIKANEQNPQGQILQIERPIHISNVALAVEGRPVKLKAKTADDGKKVLYYLKDGNEVIHRKL